MASFDNFLRNVNVESRDSLGRLEELAVAALAGGGGSQLRRCHHSSERLPM
jgi:hypothetical protein